MTDGDGADRRKTEGGELPVWVRHGMEGTRLYKIWDCMKQRCTNQNSPNFENYGGRGITVCKEWEDFVNFLSWAEKSGYKDTLSLDRKNNDGPYSPDNCRWSTRIEQQRNKRTNHFLTYNGKTRTIAEWGEITGILPATIQHRICRDGWSVEDALLTPPRKRRKKED